MLKVAELRGPLLDYWVARAEGYGFLAWEHERVMCYAFPDPPVVYAPSVDPQHAVRIMERERIAAGPVFYSTEWWAYGKDETRKQYGSSLCEAAMRCYVAEKLGSFVPEERVRIINPKNAGRYFGAGEVAGDATSHTPAW